MEVKRLRIELQLANIEKSLLTNHNDGNDNSGDDNNDHGSDGIDDIHRNQGDDNDESNCRIIIYHDDNELISNATADNQSFHDLFPNSFTELTPPTTNLKATTTTTTTTSTFSVSTSRPSSSISSHEVNINALTTAMSSSIDNNNNNNFIEGTPNQQHHIINDDTPDQQHHIINVDTPNQQQQQQQHIINICREVMKRSTHSDNTIINSNNISTSSGTNNQTSQVHDAIVNYLNVRHHVHYDHHTIIIIVI